MQIVKLSRVNPTFLRGQIPKIFLVPGTACGAEDGTISRNCSIRNRERFAHPHALLADTSVPPLRQSALPYCIRDCIATIWFDRGNHTSYLQEIQDYVSIIDCRCRFSHPTFTLSSISGSGHKPNIYLQLFNHLQYILNLDLSIIIKKNPSLNFITVSLGFIA